jgi:hypothetical protein
MPKTAYFLVFSQGIGEYVQTSRGRSNNRILFSIIAIPPVFKREPLQLVRQQMDLVGSYAKPTKSEVKLFYFLMDLYNSNAAFISLVAPSLSPAFSLTCASMR